MYSTVESALTSRSANSTTIETLLHCCTISCPAASKLEKFLEPEQTLDNLFHQIILYSLRMAIVEYCGLWLSSNSSELSLLLTVSKNLLCYQFVLLWIRVEYVFSVSRQWFLVLFFPPRVKNSHFYMKRMNTPHLTATHESIKLSILNVCFKINDFKPLKIFHKLRGL